jgi:hypothetical protein
LFPKGAPLAATYQYNNSNQTNIVGISKNGKITIGWVVGGSPWNAPLELFQADYEPGTDVAASQQFGIHNQTDVFAVNKRGNLTVIYITGSNWEGPVTLSNGGFPSKSGVAVSQRFGRDITDVFAVNTSGALTVTSVEGAGKWSGQTLLSPPNTFVPGSPLAAGRQFGLTQSDVFVVDKNGALTVTWFDGSNWNQPKRISAPGIFPPGANVATSEQFGFQDQTDVFAVNQTGQLTVSWVTKDSEWDGPQPISPSNLYTPGASLSAYQQVGINDQTDVFVHDKQGTLNVFYVTKNDPWTGPIPL